MTKQEGHPDGLEAGKLRHMVQVWRVTGSSTGGMGLPTNQYTQVTGSPFHALVEQDESRKILNAEQLKGVRYYRVTMRNRQIDPTDYLVWKGRTLNVSGSTADPFGIMTVIEATEKQVQQ